MVTVVIRFSSASPRHTFGREGRRRFLLRSDEDGRTWVAVAESLRGHPRRHRRCRAANVTGDAAVISCDSPLLDARDRPDLSRHPAPPPWSLLEPHFFPSCFPLFTHTRSRPISPRRPHLTNLPSWPSSHLPASAPFSRRSPSPVPRRPVGAVWVRPSVAPCRLPQQLPPVVALLDPTPLPFPTWFPFTSCPPDPCPAPYPNLPVPVPPCLCLRNPHPSLLAIPSVPGTLPKFTPAPANGISRTAFSLPMALFAAHGLAPS